MIESISEGGSVRETSRELPVAETSKKRITELTEARLVGRFARADLMLKEMDAFLSHGNLKAYLAHRENVERELNVFADDIELPENQIPARKSLREKFFSEDEKIGKRIEELDERAESLTKAQERSRNTIM